MCAEQEMNLDSLNTKRCTQVDLLAEISVPPRLLPSHERLLPDALKRQVDAYLRTRQPRNLVQVSWRLCLFVSVILSLCVQLVRVPALLSN